MLDFQDTLPGNIIETQIKMKSFLLLKNDFFFFTKAQNMLKSTHLGLGLV